MSELRDNLRKEIFKPKELKREKITFFGQDIEIRQPTVGEIIGIKEQADRRKAVVNLIVQYAYIPGTDERVFEDGDFEVLISFPFGDDFTRINKTIDKLITIDVAEAKENLVVTSDSGTSLP